MRLKTAFLLCALSVGMALSLPPTALAQGERILQFSSRIAVEADASLTVTETIRVRAEGDKIKRGIYRDFPQLYRGRWGLNQRTGFSVVSVSRDGQPEPFHTERRSNGERVYFGDAQVLLQPGEHTYELVYRTDRQLGFYPDHDELYWNVTGNGWDFPITWVTADVALPGGAPVTSSEAYTGPSGARGRDYERIVPESNEVRFVTTRGLGMKEGLTIVVGWPKGFVQPPRPEAKWWNLARDNPGVAAAVFCMLLVLIYYGAVWVAVGKDPAHGTIIPLYGPPKGFSPAAVRHLVRMGFDNKAFAADLVDLAVKGAVKIDRAGSDYTIRRQSAPAANLTHDEGVLFSKLMGTRSKLVLENTNHEVIGNARKALRSALALGLEKTYFVRNFWYWFAGLLFSLVPMALSILNYRGHGDAWFLVLWLTIWTGGVTVLFSQTFGLWRARKWGQAMMMTLFSLPFLGGEVFGLFGLTKETSIWVPGLFAVGAAVNGVFYHLLKAPTRAGRLMLDQIEGFRLYLSVAEKDRLNLENPPERTPELFEMFLPYALALDVEQKWTEQFETVLAAAGRDGQAYSPSWYIGTGWSTLGAAGFVGSLGTSMSSAIASSSTAPGSSSGGGGGGSSGGGGGGGGGGGW